MPRKSKRTDAPKSPISTMVGVLPAGQPIYQPFTQKLGVASNRSWMYAATRLNANQVSATPLRLYVRDRPGTKLYRTRKVSRERKAYLLGDLNHTPSTRTMSKLMDYGSDFEEVTEVHPAADLLRKVNRWMGGFDLIALTVTFADLTGNWYWYPVPGPMGPTEVWVLPSQWTEIIPSRTDFIAGYSFGMNRADAIRFTPDELLHGKYPNPGDPFYGLGVVEAGWGIVRKMFAMETMDLATYENMARPDYLISVNTPVVKQAELDAFSDALKAKLQGVKKAGSFATMSGDVKVQPLAWPPKDIVGRDLTIEEVSAVTGVPVTILRANDPNLASAQVGYASWKEMTILPKCRMIEDFLNQRLLPLFGIEDDACFAFDDPVPRNRTEDIAEAESKLRTGQRTLNEQRAIDGLPPYDDPMADVPLVNNQPLGYIAPAPSFGPASASGSGVAASEREVPDEQDGEPQDAMTEKRMAVESVRPVALLPAAPEPSELDRLREIVKAHNAEHPEAPVTDAEAVAFYERALMPTTDDVMAELLTFVRRSIDGDGAELDVLLKELEHAA